MNAPANISGVQIHREFEQGSELWLKARTGLLTASEMKLIVTPVTLKAAANDKSRAHLFELMAQRISGYVEPQFIGDEMLRGYEDEAEVRRLYCEHFEPCHEAAFITNDRWGFTIGYSPDALVRDEGQLEAKSRRQKFHTQAVIENVATQTVPTEFLVQVQTGLLVSERDWCDFIVFCSGLPMIPIRAFPDPVVQDAIVEIAGEFEKKMEANIAVYREVLLKQERLIPTERKVELEMYL